MNAVFNTNSFKSHQCFQAWRATMNNVFFPMSCDLGHDNQHFDGAIKHLPIGTGEIYGIGSQRIHYKRNKSEIKSHSSDTCQLLFILDGKAHLSQSDRQITLGAGQMCLYDTDQPFQLDMPNQYDSLVLVLPRPIMEARIPQLEHSMLQLVNSNKGVAQILSSMLLEASKLNISTESNTLSRLGGPIAEMVVLALEAELRSDTLKQIPHRTEMLSRLKLKILEQLDNPNIDLHGIASEIGIGSRTMSRLFAADGNTPMQWLWQQRLVASHKALVEGRSNSVTEVAINHGFSSLSHFSRCFKQVFGIQPKSLLQLS